MCFVARIGLCRSLSHPDLDSSNETGYSRGCHRPRAWAWNQRHSTYFENTPYYVAACMDLTEVDEEYRYSPHNLGVILHNLHPRPRALLIAIAVDPSYTQPIERVWNEYVNKVLKLEKNDSRGWQENVCVSVSTYSPKRYWHDRS